MELRATASFPTGNGLVEIQPDGALTLDRDLRDSDGDRWYWHIRLHSPREMILPIILARPNLVGRYGPWVQTEGKAGWLASVERTDQRFEIELPRDTTVDVCATVPYGDVEFDTFRRQTRARLCWESLTTTPIGCSVPYAHATTPNSEHSILLTARHHACEATASFVFEGAVLEFLRLREVCNPVALKTDLIAVPMMDPDGVAAGDQGKGRQPWDHNRDYFFGSRYASVAALRSLVESGSTPLFALDFHTPGLRGDIEERTYIVASGDCEDIKAATDLIERMRPAELDLLVFQDDWNVATSQGQRSCSAWLRSLDRTRVALTVEYPNAVDRSLQVQPMSARKIGAALLRSLLQMTNNTRSHLRKASHAKDVKS